MSESNFSMNESNFSMNESIFSVTSRVFQWRVEFSVTESIFQWASRVRQWTSRVFQWASLFQSVAGGDFARGARETKTKVHTFEAQRKAVESDSSLQGTYLLCLLRAKRSVIFGDTLSAGYNTLITACSALETRLHQLQHTCIWFRCF